MTDGTIKHLLHQLGTGSAGEAWGEFLRRYTPLIISVAQQYRHSGQDMHDCYLYICERLIDDRFHRLRSWRSKERVRFDSWLRAVVANLCIDWLRSVHGRRRPFQSITELSERARLVHTCRLEFGAGFCEGSVIRPTEQVFHWSEVPGSLFYDVRLVSPDGDLLLRRRVDETRWLIPQDLNLEPGEEYYVRVDAYLSDARYISSEHVVFTVAGVE